MSSTGNGNDWLPCVWKNSDERSESRWGLLLGTGLTSFQAGNTGGRRVALSKLSDVLFANYILGLDRELGVFECSSIKTKVEVRLP